MRRLGPPPGPIRTEHYAMEMLDRELQALINRAVLCWLATASPDGEPSVSPKEIFVHHAGCVLVANIASPRSARNMKMNPRVCVTFLDIFVQKGVQVYGRAEVIGKTDDRFVDLAAPLLTLAGGDFPFASLFRISPEATKLVVAPRYRLYPQTTEAEQAADAMAAYGVRPLT